MVNPREGLKNVFEGTVTYEPKLVTCRRDGYVPEKFDFISSSISPGPSGLGSPETTLINLALYGSLEVLDTLKFIFSPGLITIRVIRI